MARQMAAARDPKNAVLLAVGGLLGREISIEDLLRQLVDRICQAMHADRGTLYLVDVGRREHRSVVAGRYVRF